MSKRHFHCTPGIRARVASAILATGLWVACGNDANTLGTLGTDGGGATGGTTTNGGTTVTGGSSTTGGSAVTTGTTAGSSVTTGTTAGSSVTTGTTAGSSVTTSTTAGSSVTTGTTAGSSVTTGATGGSASATASTGSASGATGVVLRDGGTTTGDGATAQDGGPFPLADLDTPCVSSTARGPTGRQLLALIQGPYVGTYTPYSPRPADYPSTAPTTLSAVTIDLKYSGTTAYCKIDNFVCCPGCPCRQIDPPAVTIDLDITFKTADRVFDEAFTATATYPAPGLPDKVGWTFALPATQIRGTFPIALGTPDQVKLQFDGRFDATQHGGTLMESGPAPGGGTHAYTAGTWSAAGGSGDASADH